MKKSNGRENMSKKLIFTFVAICSSCFMLTATSAQASLNPFSAKTGLYIGAQGGYAQNNLNYDGSLPVKVDRGNIYGGANVGFEFALASEFAIGAETGVFYGKDISSVETELGTNDTKIEISNLIVPVMGTIKFVSPIGINLFAKGGAAYLRPSATESGTSYSVNWDSTWAPIAAAGVGYQIGPVDIFGQYTHIFGKKDVNFGSSNKVSNIDAVTLGVNFMFPLFA